MMLDINKDLDNYLNMDSNADFVQQMNDAFDGSKKQK